MAGQGQQRALSVYLLYCCHYCELCEAIHQGRHATDQGIAGVFLTKIAALAFLLTHPTYADDGKPWCWLIQEYIEDIRETEGDGEHVCIIPRWRHMREGLSVSDDTSDEWPYYWWYDRLGCPLRDGPDSVAKEV